MIFQEPMTSPQPGLHDRLADRRGPAPTRSSGAQRAEAALELLEEVQIPDPEARLDSIRTSSPAASASAS